MLHSFAIARPPRNGRLRALPASLAAHVAVLLVIMSPRHRTSSSAGDFARATAGSERVRYIEVAPVPAAQPSSSKPRSVAPKIVRAATTALPHVAPVSIDLSSIADVGPALPNVDLSSKVTDSLDFSAPKKTVAGGDGLGIGHEGGDSNSGVYTAELVERTVMPYPDNPRPIYPPSMLSAGVEAAFVVRFVVDTTGRVDEKSFKFPTSAGRLFVDAVQRVLLRSRYRPAELGGRRVAQLVEQQFTFRISR